MTACIWRSPLFFNLKDEVWAVLLAVILRSYFARKSLQVERDVLHVIAGSTIAEAAGDAKRIKVPFCGAVTKI
jgi:hypothetical protein